MKCENAEHQRMPSRIITYSYIRTDKLLHHTVTEACSRCEATLNTCKGGSGTCRTANTKTH